MGVLQVERELLRVEEAVQGIDGVDRVVSTATEGVGSVIIEVETGYDIREVLDDWKKTVAALEPRAVTSSDFKDGETTKALTLAFTEMPCAEAELSEPSDDWPLVPEDWPDWADCW